MTGQIVFDLEKKDNFSVDDFIISETNNEVTSTLENMDQLNISHPTYQPKVTESMDTIISMIEKIIDSACNM